jgi:hypothetical protein
MVTIAVVDAQSKAETGIIAKSKSLFNRIRKSN